MSVTFPIQSQQPDIKPIIIIIQYGVMVLMGMVPTVHLAQQWTSWGCQISTHDPPTSSDQRVILSSATRSHKDPPHRSCIWRNLCQVQ